MEKNINMKSGNHTHSFNEEKKSIEKKTMIVVIITFIAMIAEIFFGYITNSMALLADGWHMGTHAFALGIAVFAYILARKQSVNSNFTFGTWKIEILGAYSSALLLGIVGIVIAFTSIERLLNPTPILYNEAIFVAVIGLIINIVCALILTNNHSHDLEHNHDEKEHSHHNHDEAEDLNFKSAYMHVVADALTSVFAIVALLGAKYYHVAWLDPIMGILGAILIIRWASFLLKDSGNILLDHNSNSILSNEIKEHIESDNNSKISDLHLWKVAGDKYACIISIKSTKKYSVLAYKKRLETLSNLAHITIEVCED